MVDLVAGRLVVGDGSLEDTWFEGCWLEDG